MTHEEAETLAELLEANGVDEARIVLRRSAYAVQIWLISGGADACYATITGCVLHAAGVPDE